jgi:hypothetical protein
MVDARCEACYAFLLGKCDGDEDCLGPFYTNSDWESTFDGGA